MVIDVRQTTASITIMKTPHIGRLVKDGGLDEDST